MNHTVRRVRGGIGQQIVHSIDGAVRLFRSLTIHGPTRRLAVRPTARAVGAGARPKPGDGELQRLELAHRQLAQEVERLEQELERLHGTIASGSRPPGGGVEATGRRLSAFIEKARQMRDDLQEKRLELVRLERRIARERQLIGPARETEPAATQPQVVPVPARAAVPRAPLSARAVERAIREATFTDRAERSLVHGIANGLLVGEPELRRQAVVRIGGRPQPVVPLLVLAADDPDERVRLAALAALTGQRHPAVADVFRRFLRDKSASLRLAALRGLASAGDRFLTSADLVTKLADSDAGVRRAAASVLSWHHEDVKMSAEVMHALAFALYDEDESVRVAAAEALGAAGDDRAALALVRALGDASDAVCTAALRSLRSIVGPELDAAIDRAPADARVAALKAWWRDARVRLRAGAASGDAVERHGTARDILHALASRKNEARDGAGADSTGAFLDSELVSAAAGTSAVPAVRVPGGSSAAPASGVERTPNAAGASPPNAGQVPPDATRTRDVVPEVALVSPAPPPQAKGVLHTTMPVVPEGPAASPPAVAAAGPLEAAVPVEGEEGKDDFVNVFEESEDEDAGAEEYESILGDKPT